MATIDRDLKWNEVDPSTLPTGLAALYTDLKAAQRLAAQAREAFESAFTEMVKLPPSQGIAFGYRFGKLSFALTDAPAKPKPKPSRALDFAALAAMSGGHRSL